MFRPGGLLSILREDVRTIVERDPSVRNFFEALTHPALPALWTHRIAHPLYRCGLRLIARALARSARAQTGVEIHPGARLGRRVLIDHGAAVVIGETATVGDDVTIYHQVTLGAVGWWHDCLRPDGERRHPVVRDGVILGANSTVLGPITIGEGAVVGAQALVVNDIPARWRVLAPVGKGKSIDNPAAPEPVELAPSPHQATHDSIARTGAAPNATSDESPAGSTTEAARPTPSPVEVRTVSTTGLATGLREKPLVVPTTDDLAHQDVPRLVRMAATSDASPS